MEVKVPNSISIEEKAKDLQMNVSEESEELKKLINEMSIKLDVKREGTAAILAYSVVTILGILVVLPILFFFVYRVLDPGLSDFIRSIVPSLTTLLGLVFGFYFSEKRL